MRLISAAIVGSMLYVSWAEAGVLARWVEAPREPEAVAAGGLALDRGLVLDNGISLDGAATGRNGLSVDGGLARVSGLFPTFDESGLLHSDEGRAFLGRVVECALSPDQEVVKTWIDHRTMRARTFKAQGRVGLAPEWRDDKCDVECQRWVSACVLARTNAAGSATLVNMRATHPALGIEGDDFLFPEPEATFYGNLFASPARAYTCVDRDGSEGPVNERLCAGDECIGIENVGTCWRPGNGGCVDARPMDDGGLGVYSSCADGGGETWTQVISTRLNRPAR